MSQIELQAHQLLRSVVHVYVNDASVSIVGAILDWEVQREPLLLHLLLIPDQVQFELALVVLLGGLHVVFLAIAIIAHVVAGARVVAGSHRPIQLCRLLLSAGQVLL